MAKLCCELKVTGTNLKSTQRTGHCSFVLKKALKLNYTVPTLTRTEKEKWDWVYSVSPIHTLWDVVWRPVCQCLVSTCKLRLILDFLYNEQRAVHSVAFCSNKVLCVNTKLFLFASGKVIRALRYVSHDLLPQTHSAYFINCFCFSDSTGTTRELLPPLTRVQPPKIWFSH